MREAVVTAFAAAVLAVLLATSQAASAATSWQGLSSPASQGEPALSAPVAHCIS